MASFIDGNNHIVVIRQALNFKKSTTIIALFVSNMGIIKEEIRAKTLRNMEKIKQYHTKVKNIEYKEMKIQKYLLPNSGKMTKEEAQMIFKLSCRVVKVKNNLKGMFDDLQCRACGREEETQEHITIHCKKLNNN